MPGETSFDMFTDNKGYPYLVLTRGKPYVNCHTFTDSLISSRPSVHYFLPHVMSKESKTKRSE